MRIFVSTGEVSGDLQGSLLIKALFRQAEKRGIPLEVSALGGDRMAEAGATIIAPTDTISSFGVVEALPFILPTDNVQRKARRYLQEYPPDIVVLIDYHDPNIAIGNYIRKHYPDVPMVYYIAPQAWIWSPFTYNAQRIVNVCDRLLAIFPQEAKYFEAQGANTTWVGHPLLDRIENAPSRQEARTRLKIAPDCPVIALFPASRKQELVSLMPRIFAAAQRIQAQVPDVQFLIPLSLADYREEIETAIAKYQLPAQIIENQNLEVIASADLAITKSGTVNLEIALLNVPQVVLYRLNPFTMWIARHIVKFDLPFISPVNILRMESIIPELLQEEATPENIFQEAIDLLLNPQRREKMLQGYQLVREGLGKPGVCDRAASEILDL